MHWVGAILVFFAAIVAALWFVGCGSNSSSSHSTPPADDDNSPVDDDDDNDDDNDVSPDDDDDSAAGWIIIPAGDMTIRIQRDPYYLEIDDPNAKPLLATPEKTKSLNISPMQFLPHAFQVGDFGNNWWYAQKVLSDQVVSGDHVLTVRAVDVETGAKEATLTLTFHVDGTDHIWFVAEGSGVADIKCHVGAYKLDADEHFFGLGLQYEGIDQRGYVRSMFVGIGPDLSYQIQNHAPMPFYISSRGYGLFVETKAHGYFDMGDGSPTAYGYKYHDSSLKTHVFYGPDPLKIINSYTSVTGRPPMNPDYLFGHLDWRDQENTEAEMYADLDALRAHGIPTGCFQVDAPWETAYQTFEFNECPSGCQFTDAQALINYAHQEGYAFYVWTAEFVDRTSPVELPGMISDNSAEFDYAKDQNYLVSIFGSLWEYKWWHSKGAMVNFLNPAAYSWYQNLASNVMKMGGQGFKMDGGEYIGADTLGLWTVGAFDMGGFGDVETDWYNYKWQYHKLFWDLSQQYNPGSGITTIRTAVWGEQTHANYFWPGDMDHTWGTDLGLPADITAGLNLGTAGFPYYGSNDGGFHGYNTDDPELVARWTEYSGFRPIFESPPNGATEMWDVYQPPMEDIYRKYTVIHTRLYPYMKAYALQATQTGAPIMRMLPLIYMNDTNTYGRDRDYLLGDWLLVEPVYEQGLTTRDVYFPTGRWVNYWTNAVHNGPGAFNESAPLDTIPVYAKAGAIIPLLDPSIETLYPTTDPNVIDLAKVANLLWLELYPSGSTSFTLADGTSFALTQSGQGFTLTVSGAPLARTYSLRAVPATYNGASPTTVTGPSGALTQYQTYDEWNAAAKGWFYDAAAGNLWIRDACATGSFSAS